MRLNQCWFLREKWHPHRDRTRQALHPVLMGEDEVLVGFPYQPRHGGHDDRA